MTARELLESQIDESGYMLEKVFEGLTERNVSFKAGNLMSPRETLIHLTESYIACNAACAGGTHQWGSYQPLDESVAGLMREFIHARVVAREAVLAGHEDRFFELGSMYIAQHDNYHVGQMCAVRLSMDSEWDAYSIYRH